jgi:hypothetical protein
VVLEILSELESQALRASPKAFSKKLRELVAHRLVVLNEPSLRARVLDILRDADAPLAYCGKAWLDLLGTETAADIAVASGSRLDRVIEMDGFVRAGDVGHLVRLYTSNLLQGAGPETAASLIRRLGDSPKTALLHFALESLKGPVDDDLLSEVASYLDTSHRAAAFEALCRLEGDRALDLAFTCLLRNPESVWYQADSLGPRMTPAHAARFRSRVAGTPGEPVYLLALGNAPKETILAEKAPALASLDRLLGASDGSKRSLCSALVAASRLVGTIGGTDLLMKLRAIRDRQPEGTTLHRVSSRAASRLEDRLRSR